MTLKYCLFTAIMTITLTGCSAPDKQQPAIEKKSHPVSITGIVTSINPVNIDKSGKNPRFMLHFMVKIELYDDGGWDTVLGPEIKCVIKEEDLIKQTGHKIKAGDRVLIISHITESTPEVIAVYSIKFPGQEENYDKAD